MTPKSKAEAMALVAEAEAQAAEAEALAAAASARARAARLRREALAWTRTSRPPRGRRGAGCRACRGPRRLPNR